VGDFSFTFSPDSSRLALFGEGQPGGMIPTAIYRLATGLKEKVFPGRRTFQYMSFAPDGKSLYLLHHFVGPDAGVPAACH